MKAISKPLLTALVAVGLVAGAMAMGGFASQHTDGPSTQETAYLRIAHVSPDAPAVDVYVDNESVLTNVSFGSAGHYMQVEGGDHNVTITTAGDRDDVVLEENVTVENRTVTTLAASGEITANAETEFELRNYTDDAFEPGEDEAAVRVVHLSPDADTVDVTIRAVEEDAATETATEVATATETEVATATATEMATETPGEENETMVLAEDLEFSNDSGYVSLPAGDYVVEVREDTTDADGDIIAEFNVTVEGGTAYTAWASGFVEPSAPLDTQEFVLNVTEDATVTVNLPETATATPTETATEPATETATETGMETETATETGMETETATEASPAS